MDYFCDTEQIVEQTGWCAQDPDPVWDRPEVWAHQVDHKEIWLHGPVRPTMAQAGRVLVGTMNGDVNWFLDLEPPLGGTPGQVIAVDIESATWEVVASSWRELLVRYADDLEQFRIDPASSALEIDSEVGPGCEWRRTHGPASVRPVFLQDVRAQDPHA